MIYNNYNVVQNIYEMARCGENRASASSRQQLARDRRDREIGLARSENENRQRRRDERRIDSLSKSAAGL